MALRPEEAMARAWTLRELYAACDPASWDSCRQRGEPWRAELRLLSSTPWTDFADWKWTAWHKYLRRIALGFMRHPSKQSRRGAERIESGTRGRWVAGDVGIVEPVQAACELAGLTARQTEVWILSVGDQLSQRAIAQVLKISQRVVNKHLANAHSRLGREWGGITSGLEIEGTSRGCAWRYRGFECRVCCKQFQTKTTEV